MTSDQVTKRLRESSVSARPKRIMLLAIVDGITSTSELADRTKSKRDSIRNWKNLYRRNGIEGLLKEGRGDKRHGILDEAQKDALQKKL